MKTSPSNHSPELDPPRLLIVFTLPEEAGPLRRRWRRTAETCWKTSLPGCALESFWLNVCPGNPPSPTGRRRDAFLVDTVCCGAGMASAQEITARCIRHHPDPPSLVLCLGYAGGLNPALPDGDLIASDSVHQSDGDSIAADSVRQPDGAPPLQPDPSLHAIACSIRSNRFGVHSGILITGNRVLTYASEKKEFARRTGGEAVDMESYGAALAARDAGVPFLAVRAITDSACDDMPFDFNTLSDRHGNPNRLLTAGAALTHPWKIPGLLRLAGRSARASAHLAEFVEQLLQRLPEVDL